MKVIIQHELGWCKILQNDFETSRALFEDFLANTKSENQKTWCYYQLGLCYLCLGQNEKAMECFAKVKQFKKSQHGFDDYATRKAVDFMAKGGASLEEIILQKAMHSKRCNNIVEANKYLKEFDEECSSTANPDMAAWAHYLKGKVARYEKNFEVARIHFQHVIDVQKTIKKEKYIVPHSKYKLLLIDLEEKTITIPEALLRIKEIEKYSDYDFERSLRRRLLKIKDKLHVKEDISFE